MSGTRAPRAPGASRTPVPVTLDRAIGNGAPGGPGAPLGGDAQEAVRLLLHHLGEDPEREGLVDTPRRVLGALGELTAGYRADVGSLLAVTFQESYDELIVVRRTPFWSLCEHHLLPFTGHATVGYLPRDGIVGLSKLARLVEVFARRLQVQERMTAQIADALVEHVRPLAVGVIVEATHTCMAMRGVQRTAPMVTSCLRGLLRERADLRAEFLAFAGFR